MQTDDHSSQAIAFSLLNNCSAEGPALTTTDTPGLIPRHREAGPLSFVPQEPHSPVSSYNTFCSPAPLPHQLLQPSPGLTSQPARQGL